MDQSQLPWSNDGYANQSMFPEHGQFNSFDQFFTNEADVNSFDPNWPMSGTEYAHQPQSRVSHHPNTQQAWMHQPQHGNTLAPPSTFNDHRSLSHSPEPHVQGAFHGYGAPQQNFQYWQHQQFDPSLVAGHPQNYPQQQTYNFNANTFELQNPGTIAPHALQHEPQRPIYLPNPYERPSFATDNSTPRPSPAQAPPPPIEPARPNTVDQAALAAAVPKGNAEGHFSVIDLNELSKATNSEPMAPFLHVGKEALEWNVSRAAIPAYVPRKSRNELRKLAENDPKLLARLGKKIAKKANILPKPAVAAAAAGAQSDERIKYEGETSSEDESSEEDDNSSYTTDSDSEQEAPPLPSKPPTDPKEAVEYETIKALWRGKRKTVSSDSVRKGVIDFWEVVKTIRDRWKADSTALTQATEKNPKDLPLLESRVKDQRDLIETAFKAALKFGSRGIVELLASNASLVFLCYQFLLDRAKADDYNGMLARTILETMSTFTTLSEDVMERTYLVKVLPRYIKKGDAKTQFYAKRITSNAAAASSKQNTQQTEQAAKKPAAPTEKSPTGSPLKRPNPEPVAGIKRAASAASDAGAAKKVATGSAKPGVTASVAKPGTTVKKVLAPTGKMTASIAAAKPKPAPPKPAPAKPSGLFSSLQSATKKPGTSIAGKAALVGGVAGAKARPQDKSATATASAAANAAPKSTFSFADTMAALSKPKEEQPTPKDEKEEPSSASLETDEEKTKRLRKESRRHLHVSFKPMPELEEIREFVHDSDEDFGHDPSQMRDVSDVGGEGRMFKQQHQMMDIDDEDEIAEEQQEVEEQLIEFSPPQPIDFSVLPAEERSKNFAPYGGGENEPDSPERNAREAHEANTLIVIYTSPEDIPPDPVEPADPFAGQDLGPAKDFAAPEEQYFARARAKNAKRAALFPAATIAAPGNPPAPTFDFAKFASYTNNPNAQLPAQSMAQPQPQQQQQQQQPQAPSSEALSSILASLRNNMAASQSQAPPQQQQQPQPQPQANPFGGFPPQFDGYSQPAPPQQQPQAQAQPPPAAALPSGQPDLAAILATLRGQSSASSSNATPNSSFGQQPQQQQPYLGQMGNYSGNDDEMRGGGGGGGSGGGGKKQHPFWRTKTCMYWQQGKCQKGDACSYKHEE